MSNTSDKGTTFGDGAARVELYSIDVAATFGVPLTTVGDLQKLINDIDVGKHDELLSELTNEDRMETLEALGSICNSIKVDRNNADVIPCKVSYADDSINLNVDESTTPSDPIVQFVDINKSTSYAGVTGGSTKDQPNVNSNFRTLVADPKWSMDTRLLKEELTHIPIWVKLHDVPIQDFEEDVISLIATFIEADLVDVVTIGIPSLSEDDFTKETIRVDPPIVGTSNFVTLTVEKINDGFQMVGKKKKRKGKSKSTNGGQFTGSSVKQNVRYQPNATTSAPKKGVTNVEEDDEEDVQNVYDESANLILNTKAGGRSSFMAAAG
ncbi:zinc knuckle CX2CX4HX4C containing protein [Tanacetum coccineum]